MFTSKQKSNRKIIVDIKVPLRSMIASAGIGNSQGHVEKTHCRTIAGTTSSFFHVPSTKKHGGKENEDFDPL